ncbi:MAG: hypothetical protein KBD76_15280 [Bacteriovorax sp.]|nr:hypothetical protein [Bacteriovorax sp.]
MTSLISFDEAIILLKKFVKFSEVKNQKHIDLALCAAQERALAQEALMVVNMACDKGELTQDQLKAKLGL